MVMVVNLVDNHPPSIGSVRMIELVSRIDQIRRFLSYGLLGCLLLVVNNSPFVSPTVSIKLF